MQIIVMRHGEAIYQGEDRILSSNGQKEALLSAKKIYAFTNITKAYCSNKTRAIETAKIVLEQSPHPLEAKQLFNLSPSGDAQAVIEEIRLESQALDNVLLVSHIPIVYDLVQCLNPALQIPSFDTAAAYILEEHDQVFVPKILITPFNEYR